MKEAIQPYAKLIPSIVSVIYMAAVQAGVALPFSELELTNVVLMILTLFFTYQIPNKAKTTPTQ